jgi:hypothetical protein
MPSKSQTPSETARKMHCMVLQRLQESGLAVAIAAQIGVSEATISRLKNEHLETLCSVLAYAGLKIVPAEAQCVSPDTLSALVTFAKAHMAAVTSASELSVDP